MKYILVVSEQNHIMQFVESTPNFNTESLSKKYRGCKIVECNEEDARIIVNSMDVFVSPVHVESLIEDMKVESKILSRIGTTKTTELNKFIAKTIYQGGSIKHKNNSCEPLSIASFYDVKSFLDSTIRVGDIDTQMYDEFLREYIPVLEAKIQTECKFKSSNKLTKKIESCLGLPADSIKTTFNTSVSSIITLKTKESINKELSRVGVVKSIYDRYLEGCNLLDISPEPLSMYAGKNDELESIVFNRLKSIDFISNNNPDKSFNPSIKKLKSTIDNQRVAVANMSNREIVYSDKSKDSYLKSARLLIQNVSKVASYCKTNNIKEVLGTAVAIDISGVLQKIAMLEVSDYYDYNLPVGIESLLTTDLCLDGIFKHGVVHTYKYIYVREETESEILKMIPTSPEMEYPAARAIKRKFIIHYGPTNSGKTYGSIEALKAASSGTYLGPLRLLALEIQDKLQLSGVPCSMLTGEEEEIVPGAQHVSSTVEKADMKTLYDICVIDECQLINDPSRGFAWTKAILGMQAKEIHLCMGPEALDICLHLISLCGDDVEIVEHTRRSKLVVQKHKQQPGLNASFVEPGDAYIVFSKKKVIHAAAELMSKGFNVSVIYGSLPYSVRKGQVDKFLSGEAEVVVSTDAIGMGINLPVNRVIFLETEKYNGKEVAPLDTSTIKQVAGRAGRNEETGFVSSIQDIGFIENNLMIQTPITEYAFLGFSDEIINIDAELSDILKVWKQLSPPERFKRMDIDRYLKLDQMINLSVSKREKLKMINIPFEERNPIVLEHWLDYCDSYDGNQELYIPKCTGYRLEDLENYYKCLDLYYSFSKNFDLEIDLEWLRYEKEKISEKITESLASSIKAGIKICEKCGVPIKWNIQNGLCRECNNEKRNTPRNPGRHTNNKRR